MKRLLAFGVCLLGLVTSAQAALELALTTELSTSDNSAVNDEAWFSAEVLWDGAAGAWDWYLYIDANATPRQNGTGLRLPSSNGDLGSALDSEGRGRVILAEAMLGYSFAKKHRIAVGWFIPSSYLDTSDIANDETSQFVALSFFGNLAFVYPDYAPGLLYSYHDDSSHWVLAINSSDGFQQNPNASYRELFDPKGQDEGVFVGLEYGTQVPSLTHFQNYLRVGGWFSSGDEQVLDDASLSQHNYGMYLGLDQVSDLWSFNYRLGFANSKVSAIAGFASAVATRPLAAGVLGLGVAHQQPARGLGAEAGPTMHVEAHWRYAMRSWLLLTPYLQYQSRPELGLDEELGGSSWLFGLRLSFEWRRGENGWAGLF